jgi:hypothetical protein
MFEPFTAIGMIACAVWIVRHAIRGDLFESRRQPPTWFNPPPSHHHPPPERPPDAANDQHVTVRHNGKLERYRIDRYGQVFKD